MTISVLESGHAKGILIQGVIHILKRSSSSFFLIYEGERKQYCCVDGCCDNGAQPDVRQIVEQAKALGAEKVVLRTSLRNRSDLKEIAGLPVEDVSNYVGDLCPGVSVGRWR